MTKIKNTKKGMAKKTLSMSLVVAMLATSNVPVWAAEFSDGSDDVAVATEAPAAETFSDETAEAPVVEDTTAEAASANTVVEEGDLKVDVTVNKTEVTWGDRVTVSGTITKTSDNTPLKSWNYGIREAGTTQALGTIKTATDPAQMSFDTDETMAGKTIELYIYRDDANASFGPIVVGTIKVNKKNIKDATINVSGLNADGTLTYNGRVQDETTVTSVTLGTGSASTTLTKGDDYEMTVSSATNVGDTLVVTVTAKGDKYYGTVTKNIKIVAKDYNSGDIKAKVKDDVKYEYTGSKIYLKASDVTVAESKHDPDVTPDDQKLGGADLSSAIESVETKTSSDYNVGKHKATVKLETGKLGNFNFSGAYESVDTSNEYEIVARDLSKVKVVAGSNGEVQLGTKVSELPLKFYDGSQPLYLKSADYSYTVKVDGKVIAPTTTNPEPTFDKEGTYTVEITAADGVSNTKNSVSTTFRVEGNVIDSATSTGFNNSDTNKTIKYVKDYTGKAIEPTKDDIGTVTITSKGTLTSPAKTVTLQKGEWEIVGYSNNIEASTYGNTSATAAPYSYKKYASVQIKVTQSGTFYGKTCSLNFEIAPLKVSSDTITVPKTTSFDKANRKASDYKLDVTVNAKDSNNKTITVPASAYTTTAKFLDATTKQETDENAKENIIETTVVLKDHNYIYVDSSKDYDSNGKTQSVVADKKTTIKAPVLTNASVVLTQDSYTYTGGKITPSFKVMDGTLELQEDVDYRIKSITNAVNVGTATITVEGLGTYYSGEASGTFTITPAKVEDVKVTAEAKTYTGKKIKPTSFKATLNGNDVSDQFKLSAYGDNTNAGKTAGSLTIALLSGNKNFTGSTVDGTFEIKPATVTGSTISVFDKYGKDVSSTYGFTTGDPSKTFTYDGTAQTFASTKLNIGSIATGVAKPTADDFEIVYVDNVYGKSTTGKTYNTAHVYAVAKEGGNYAGPDNSKIVTADGTTIKNVVADLTFGIGALKFVKENVTVKNGVYAGGVAVKPEVIVQFGGNTLVEGVDYKLEYDTATEVTNGAKYDVKVTGINGYAGAGSVSSKDTDTTKQIAKWGIDKQTIANCEVSVKNGVATVMNGSVKVPADEYTSTKNDDGTYTIAAKSTSKHYTGSKTVKADGKAENEKPNAPMISNVKVVGNKATVILSGESEGASGYDYVISTDRDCITNKDYTSVNKNQVKTNTTFEYVGQNTYYAYCHAWKRDENGKKVFSDWSNAYPFVVSAITPSQPVITSVKVKGSTVTVTYTKASNADGYDVVLGTSTKKVNGETRPVEYGKLVKKNIKGNVVTATFKNVKKGTYYAGLHAFNKTSEDGKKVFSQWSNVKKVNVK